MTGIAAMLSLSLNGTTKVEDPVEGPVAIQCTLMYSFKYLKHIQRELFRIAAFMNSGGKNGRKISA
jgi:hypothetical protein